MELTFFKYEGTGNDFIMVDNRSATFPKHDVKWVARLCDRRFGIGADGLILLEPDDQTDFRMVYYNSDGNPSSMCGNGGRCIVAFAKKLGIVEDRAVFIATDGLHHATIAQDGTVSLQMKDVDTVETHGGFTFLDTGSPHHVQLEENLGDLDVRSSGAKIRYSTRYGQAGTNVNFVRPEPDGTFSIRTYERGVEDETLSCGTGATAAAIAMHATGKTDHNAIIVHVQGGRLGVSFEAASGRYANVWLTGPAQFVFKGMISC